MSGTGGHRDPRAGPGDGGPGAVFQGEDEKRLLRDAQAGDRQAFAEIVRRHQDAVFGLVLRMVGDRGTAEEITQDVFLKAHRALPGFRGEARLATWLYRIAVNLCRDHHGSRAARRRREELSLDAMEAPGRNLADPAARPDDEAVLSQLRDAFRQAVEALPEGHRAAFLLRHQEGLGYEEIAAVLEISRANAKVRVHRAREMILATLRRRGHEV